MTWSRPQKRTNYLMGVYNPLLNDNLLTYTHTHTTQAVVVPHWLAAVILSSKALLPVWLEIIVSLEKNSGASQWINISSFYNPAWKQRNACRHNLQASLQICSQQMWLCWHILSDVSCPFKHFIFRRGDLDISNRIMTHFSPNIFQYGMMGKLLFIDVISQLTNKKGFSMKSLTSTQKHYPVHSDHLKRTTVIKHLPSTFF